MCRDGVRRLNFAPRPLRLLAGDIEFFELGATLPDREFLNGFLKEYLDSYHAC